ncbi:MAG: hypothetical protein IKZ49_03165 [Alphaproteobacteria bacterium]|nr:hypothetical protein [Alphaproteobacteria bacterium]
METFLGYVIAVIFVTIILTIKDWFVAKNSNNETKNNGKDKKKHRQTLKKVK